MSRPLKHPNTGVYYFRKVVPEGLRPVIGKREIKVSLRTKDPAIARAAHAAMAADVDRQLAGLRSPAKPLTNKQITALAGIVYRELVDQFTDDPGEAAMWEYLTAWSHAFHKLSIGGGDWYGTLADNLLLKHGIHTDQASRQRLIEALHKAIQQAGAYLKKNAEGDYRPDPDGDRFPAWEPPAPVPQSRPAPMPPTPSGETVTGLVEGWWKERKAANGKQSTYESYRNTVGRFVAFLGHNDAGRLTAADVIAFKDHRLAEVNPKTGKPVAAKTVKDSDLAGLKSVFGWAVGNRRMASNPAEGITIKVGKRPRLREKGFTEAEAHALLSAAWNLQRGQEQPKTYAAKHWTPWLCAYSGARIGEMVQLRKEDVRQEAGYWVMRITPEAGTVKTSEARDVVLHPHLIELGFPQFVAASKPGHLFLTPAGDGTTRGPWRGVKNRVAEFARSVVTDPNVLPNHGWRHRFRTVGMEVGIATRILDAIDGHAARTVADQYGDVTLRAKAAAMEAFPSYAAVAQPAT